MVWRRGCRALGAGPREILQLILGECLGLTGLGIALGFALTVVAGLGMRPLLFDVSPFDPITLMGSIVVIATATIAASRSPPPQPRASSLARRWKTESGHTVARGVIAELASKHVWRCPTVINSVGTAAGPHPGDPGVP